VNERNDVVERAMGYPYSVPLRPFVQAGHRTLDPDEIELRGERLPLLAYGSNSSPEVLARKLSLNPEPVLVTPARLQDFDVVYSAHISPYGAVPATLQRSPGTAARVCVAYLTSAQLALLSSTEPNYELATLRPVNCRTDGGQVELELSAYLSRHGCLLLDGTEVALSAVQAGDRCFVELSEAQVLERVRASTCPEEDMETFVLSNVTDPALAQARSAMLERHRPSLL
jgi:hypothetical protein